MENVYVFSPWLAPPSLSSVAPLTSRRAPLKGLRQTGLASIKKSPSLPSPSACLPEPRAVLWAARRHASGHPRGSHGAITWLPALLLPLLLVETSELCKCGRGCLNYSCATWQEVNTYMIWGFNLNLGLSMSIISWRCVSCSVITYLLIFMDIRTGMHCSVAPLNLLLRTEGNWKSYTFFL